MQVIPILDPGLGNSAYLVDLGDGGALVIDPQRDPRPHLALLAAHGLGLRMVVETHLHADFVSGAAELTALGADLAAPAGSGLAAPHRPLHHGDELDLGGLVLQVLATPGHTPEHLAYVLRDGSRAVAVFSGGALTAGGAARTDLLSADQTVPLAHQAWRSITEVLLSLPDDTPVLPTHGGGSFCTTGGHGGHTTTIGRERRTNPLLVGVSDAAQFADRLVAGYGTHPPYFLRLRDVNRSGPRRFGPDVALPALSPAEVQALVDSGAAVVDARDTGAFAEGHVPGSVSDAWRPAFATWAGWLLDPARPVVLVLDETIPAEDVVWALRTVGIEDVRGVLAGGIGAWAAEGRTIARTAMVSGRQAVGTPIDVRQAAEHAAAHAEGALPIELGAIAADPGAVPDGPVLLHCGHGERAMTAASLLEGVGRSDVVVLAGGPADLGRA